MKFLTTIIGILPVLCAVAPASAALQQAQTQRTNGRNDDLSRISTISIPGASNLAAARRLPTLKVPGATTNINVSSGSSSGSSDSALMDEVECVERYTECIKASDVCDFNFEECTTKELFYAKKPQCNSVLLQCSAAGINTLFGTSVTTNLSAKNDNGEYVYPTAGSVLGQFIEAGAISNRLDTSSCVKRYTSCLKKDNVCGEDFELCTTNSEFKKQKIYCESTLARCQEDGIRELFGQTDTTRNPTDASRLGVMITEGQQLAALNSVSTCYKIADQCVLNACSANPYKCIANSDTLLADVVDAIKEGRQLTEEQMKAVASARTKADVSKYIKGLCYETIAGNRYCYATVLKSMPTNKQLLDEENRDEIYADIISSTMTRVDNQLQSTLDKFDKQTKDTCSDVITSCAMRSCGGGLGSACYSKVFGSTDTCFTSGGFGNSSGSLTTCSINASNTYNEIRLGCEAIVNTDANCQYAAASASQSGYNYSYADIDTFGIVFPEKSKGKDPIGVVARLNKSLKENYDDAAIERMGKQCENIATSCIKSMCGTDFKSCYRNRTDIMTDTYTVAEGGTNNIDKGFADSMNKVGGVLDFTIIRGLCLETVKSASVCEEHLKIQAVKNNTDDTIAGWGKNKTVRDAWVGAVSTGYSTKQVDVTGEVVETGLCVIDKSSATSEICKSKTDAMQCDYVDEDGCLYSVEQLIPRKDYLVSMAADTLFQKVMGDLEKKAQADYNAKLTREQHMCNDANNGGIMGRNDHSSTYMWVKLRKRKVPTYYPTSGLKTSDFDKSNDLYGSFCRARVTLQSDDPDIQTALQKGQSWSTAYFAVGDVFTCGSWIPQKELEKIAKRVACKKAQIEGKIDRDIDCNNAIDYVLDNLKLTVGQQWAVAASAVGGAGLLGAGMDLLQSKTGLGGLLRTADNTTATQRLLMESLTNAQSDYNSHCQGTNAVKDKCDTGAACFSATTSFIGGKYPLQSFTFRSKDGGYNATCEQLSQYVTDVKKWIDVDETGALKDKLGQKWIRAGADIVAATAGGVVGGIGVANAIKAANRQQFTADEQQFMNNVGEHIYCFIGADEAGTYGDLIEISVE